MLVTIFNELVTAFDIFIIGLCIFLSLTSLMFNSMKSTFAHKLIPADSTRCSCMHSSLLCFSECFQLLLVFGLNNF